MSVTSELAFNPSTGYHNYKIQFAEVKEDLAVSPRGRTCCSY